VTPSVESAADPRRNIRLNIQIDDGAFNTSMSVDGIPKVDNHSIVTQAIVRDGESLLVGGYQYERSESSTSKVPVLGDVPYVGALFRDTQTTRQRLERLILITPRLKRAAGTGEAAGGAVMAGPAVAPAGVGAVFAPGSGLPGVASVEAGSLAQGAQAAQAAQARMPPLPAATNIPPAVAAALRAPSRGAASTAPPPVTPLPSPPPLPAWQSTRKMPWEDRNDR
jgi:type III secretion protein C